MTNPNPATINVFLGMTKGGKQGIRVHFPEKPGKAAISSLKKHGFRWNPAGSYWWSRDTDIARQWAKDRCLSIQDDRPVHASQPESMDIPMAEGTGTVPAPAMASAPEPTEIRSVSGEVAAVRRIAMLCAFAQGKGRKTVQIADILAEIASI